MLNVTIELPLWERIYETLRINRLVKSQRDFSTRFLGRSMEYYGVMKHEGWQPSKDAVQNVLGRLAELTHHLPPDRSNMVRELVEEITAFHRVF